MKNKERGMFSGFSSVFSFTAEQNMKAKGFRFSSIGIGLFIFAICAALSVIMAVMQKPDEAGEKEEDKYGIEENLGGNAEEEKRMDTIVVLNNAGLSENILTDFVKLCGYEDMEVVYSDLKINGEYKEFAEYCTGNYKSSIGLQIDVDEENQLTFSYLMFPNTKVSGEFVKGFAQSFELYYNDMKYLEMGIGETEIEILNLPAGITVTETGKDMKETNLTLAQIFIPMVFSLLLFMMTCLYGQSVTKVVMSEKSSKLMEMLLTSVKPYALISGKVLAISVTAIVQMAVWILLGVLGFFAGDVMAQAIYPDYHNILFEIVNMIQKTSTGFSASVVVIAILMTVIGFFMYCVWAGLIASVVDKVDDVSTAMGLFQIPVILGFFISYFGSAAEMNGLIKVSEYVPVVSPFVMPADLLVGKVFMAEGIISLLVLIAFTFVLVLVTGKLYKNKVFHRK